MMLRICRHASRPSGIGGIGRVGFLHRADRPRARGSLLQHGAMLRKAFFFSTAALRTLGKDAGHSSGTLCSPARLGPALLQGNLLPGGVNRRKSGSISRMLSAARNSLARVQLGHVLKDGAGPLGFPKGRGLPAFELNRRYRPRFSGSGKATWCARGAVWERLWAPTFRPLTTCSS